MSDRALSLTFALLASYLKAGYTPRDAFLHLGRRVANRRLEKACLQLAHVAQSGESLSRGMEELPEIFPGFVRGVIRSAEMGGYLPEASNQLASFFQGRTKRRLWFWVPRLLIVNAIMVMPLPMIIWVALLEGLKFYSESPQLNPFQAYLLILGTLSRLAQMYEARSEQAAIMYRFGVLHLSTLLVILAFGAYVLGYAFSYLVGCLSS